ncbi:cilia- and flagella-associated protein 337-like isoform 1-T2 [Spinachia spinachia]
MSLLRARRLRNSTGSPKDLWVTDAVLLPNVHKIAVSFTSKEVCFYDILSKQEFQCKHKVQGLKFTPWCSDYWADPFNPDHAVLSIGDNGGQVSVFYFTLARISLLENPRTDSDSADIIRWGELVEGKHRPCYTVTHRGHTPAWVRKVCYLDPLDAVVPCSTRAQSSVLIGWGGGRQAGVYESLLSSQRAARGTWTTTGDSI